MASGNLPSPALGPRIVVRPYRIWWLPWTFTKLFGNFWRFSTADRIVIRPARCHDPSRWALRPQVVGAPMVSKDSSERTALPDPVEPTPAITPIEWAKRRPKNYVLRLGSAELNKTPAHFLQKLEGSAAKSHGPNTASRPPGSPHHTTFIRDEVLGRW
jgi:hypothetical protein